LRPRKKNDPNCIPEGRPQLNALSCSLKFNPDKIKATKISSRLNRRPISKRANLTGQVGQAGQADQHGYTQIMFFLRRRPYN